MEQQMLKHGNTGMQEDVFMLKGRIMGYIDNFFPDFREGCITAVKKMTNEQNLLVHINLRERKMSFEALSVNNHTSYAPLFLLNELEDSFLKKVEIRKTKNFKEQILVIEESLNLAYPILDVINDLFY